VGTTQRFGVIDRGLRLNRRLTTLVRRTFERALALCAQSTPLVAPALRKSQARYSAFRKSAFVMRREETRRAMLAFRPLGAQTVRAVLHIGRRQA
jgi:hypothetical protein